MTPAPPGSASTSEQRISGRGADFACVRVDPRNKDVIYVANTSTYRSTDAGQSFTAIKGAPGGDDYHTIWINPRNPDIILLAARPGRHHHRQRRPHLEFLVQPADRAVLPRHHRQPVPLLGLRRTAGERLRGRRQPRQRWPDHLPRVASRGRRRVCLRRARSAESEHHLRRRDAGAGHRRGHPLQPRHRRHRTRRAPAATHRHLRTAARALFRGRPAHPLHRHRVGAQDHRWRPQLGEPSVPTSPAKATKCPPAWPPTAMPPSGRPPAAVWSIPSRLRA